jgi:hypothetical protein
MSDFGFDRISCPRPFRPRFFAAAAGFSRFFELAFVIRFSYIARSIIVTYPCTGFAFTSYRFFNGIGRWDIAPALLYIDDLTEELDFFLLP